MPCRALCVCVCFLPSDVRAGSRRCLSTRLLTYVDVPLTRTPVYRLLFGRPFVIPWSSLDHPSWLLGFPRGHPLVAHGGPLSLGRS